MTYASIKLPYELKKNKVDFSPKTKESLMGKLKSAAHSGKNFIENSGAVFSTLGEYMQTAEPIVSKFSGIAVAQMLANGKVTNKDALDYLFLGFAPAMDKQAIAMGYSGATQMKDAIANGSINVGSFVSGFSKVLKGITDFNNSQKNKQEQNANNIIELDITLNHNEQYQSESPDRRTEKGVSYQEVLHNLPEIFSLECGLQDGRRYGIEEFKGYLTQLRDSKQPFDMIIGDGEMKNVVLQNFNPSVVGARSGLDYTLELKKIHIGSVETVPITIEPLDISLYKAENEKGIGTGGISNVKNPNIVNNPTKDDTKLTPNKKQSMWAYTTDLGGGNAAKGALKLMGIGNENL